MAENCNSFVNREFPIYNGCRPSDVLHRTASELGVIVFSKEFAQLMDQEDNLAAFRYKFCIPLRKYLNCEQIDTINQDSECIYLASHMIGLKPKSANSYVEKSLDEWGNRGVKCLSEGWMPVNTIDLQGLAITGTIVGAKPEEIAIMNTLTIDLHLLLVSFYKPNPTRHKILMEADAFTSQRYAAQSQLAYHGYDTKESMIYVHPRKGEHTIRQEDIEEIIENQGESIALILFSGLNFLTGQKFNIKRITKIGHKKGCIVGFDLAHNVGNTLLRLHEWNIDFACWCSYKYLNSGPGGIGGLFIHEKYSKQHIAKFHGGWSSTPEKRRQLLEDLDLTNGAAGMRISAPDQIRNCVHLASLQIFKETTMENLVDKQFLLTGYLELLLNHYFIQSPPIQAKFIIVTPDDPEQRGSQLSLKFTSSAEWLPSALEQHGVLVDVRKDKVLRISPSPLYNSFLDIFNFLRILKEVFKKMEMENEEAIEIST